MVLELTLILSSSYIFCGMTIPFLSALGKYSPYCLIETKIVFEIVLKDMAMKGLERQLKLMTLIMVCIENRVEEMALFTAKQKASTKIFLQLLEL